MKKSLYFFILSLIFISLTILIINNPTLSSDSKEEKIIWGRWSRAKVNKLLSESNKINSVESRVDFISAQFLGTKYLENTLIGNNDTSEILTINFDGMDCFTYLDYVEALSLSANFEDFKINLIHVRYKNNSIDYKNRKHFFSDWIYENALIKDITNEIAPAETKSVVKNLNKKSDFELFLKDIPITKRTIEYIPSENIDSTILEKLRNGDFIGIYTPIDGLDVSHTGILIKKDNLVYLRHASSKEKNKKVVDENFLEYIKSKPGIVVYRNIEI